MRLLGQAYPRGVSGDLELLADLLDESSRVRADHSDGSENPVDPQIP